MPYTAPPTWAHGQYPTAAAFNAYKASLDAILAQTGSAQVNPMVCRRMETVQGYYIMHRHNWLIYIMRPPHNSGTLEDPAGAGDPVSLPVSTDWTFYDLNSVEWLYPGKLYQIQGVTCCMEDLTSL